MGRQAAPTGGQQQAVHGMGAAGLLAVQVGVQRQNGLGRGGILAGGLVVTEEMGQVGTDHDQGLIATPEPVQYPGHGLRRRTADRQGHQTEVIQHALQEGQMHLQGMLLGVGQGLTLHLG